MKARLAENMPASAEVQNRPAPPRPPFALEEDLRGGDTSQVGAMVVRTQRHSLPAP